MTPDEKKQLQITACKIRMGIINATHGAKAGHPGGALSATEMFTYLFPSSASVSTTSSAIPVRPVLC